MDTGDLECSVRGHDASPRCCLCRHGEGWGGDPHYILRVTSNSVFPACIPDLGGLAPAPDPGCAPEGDLLRRVVVARTLGRGPCGSRPARVRRRQPGCRSARTPSDRRPGRNTAGSTRSIPTSDRQFPPSATASAGARISRYAVAASHAFSRFPGGVQCGRRPPAWPWPTIDLVVGHAEVFLHVADVSGRSCTGASPTAVPQNDSKFTDGYGLAVRQDRRAGHPPGRLASRDPEAAAPRCASRRAPVNCAV